MKNHKLYKTAIIGTGRMACEHIKVISKFKEFKLISVMSKKNKNAKRFASKYKIKNFFCNFDNFSKIKYDIIFLCVPPNKNFKILKKCLSLKCKVFTEKPIGVNYYEVKKLMNIFDKDNLYNKLYVGYNRRFLGSVMQCKKNIDKISKKRIVKINDQQDIYLAKKFGHSSKTIKNWEYANCIHTIDLLAYFCRGKPKKINSNKLIISKKRSIIVSSIIFSSGDLAIYTCFWNIPGSWSIKILTELKKFELSPLEKLKISSNSNSRYYKDFKNEKKFKPGFYMQFLEIRKMLNGKKHNLVDINEAIKSVELVNKIYSNVK